MAVYVLMAFDDELNAKNFIQATLAEPQESIIPEGEVVGAYKKPTMFCDPMDGKHTRNRRVTGFTKGTKWGWWVCAMCGKPRKRYSEAILENTGLGFNILKRLLAEKEKPVDSP